MRLVKCFLLSVLVFSGHASAELDDQQESNRLIVHLLDYLARDYGGAVSAGQVISDLEYAEQIEFAKSALSAVKNSTALAADPEIESDLQKLNQMILDKVPEEELASLARDLQSRVIHLSELESFPTHWPNLKSGKNLYEKLCQSCHGVSGAGDGPAGAALDPKPSNFLGDTMTVLSPFQAYNTIRLGVPGTGMQAYSSLSEEEVWNLAFYVVGLRHIGARAVEDVQYDENVLKNVATKSDAGLLQDMGNLDPALQSQVLAALRQHSGKTFDQNDLTADAQHKFISIGRNHLIETLRLAREDHLDSARNKALRAYLEGVEPIETRLKANDPNFVINLEGKMAALRTAIEQKAPYDEIEKRVRDADQALIEAEILLKSEVISPKIAFASTLVIMLREGFEALLIILVLLGIVRASGVPQASRWIHTGWMLAIGTGIVAWFLSGYLIKISGTNRETLEGLISLTAVGMLLYLGFWLHTQTEIGRWRRFLEVKIKGLLDHKKLFALGLLAFIAVFREVFETVLFLRAIAMESGASGEWAIFAGTMTGLICVLISAWLLLKTSAKLPLRQLFLSSAFVMIALAVILMGKGLHSLQEAGLVPLNPFASPFNLDLIGFYPTLETWVGQLAVLILGILLWFKGKKKSPKAL